MELFKLTVWKKKWVSGNFWKYPDSQKISGHHCPEISGHPVRKKIENKLSGKNAVFPDICPEKKSDIYIYIYIYISL